MYLYNLYMITVSILSQCTCETWLSLKILRVTLLTYLSSYPFTAQIFDLIFLIFPTCSTPCHMLSIFSLPKLPCRAGSEEPNRH